MQIKYISGYPDIPGRIKAALSVIVNDIAAKGVADREHYTAGSVARTFKTPAFIAVEAQRLLDPFVIRTYS